MPREIESEGCAWRETILIGKGRSWGRYSSVGELMVVADSGMGVVVDAARLVGALAHPERVYSWA